MRVSDEEFIEMVGWSGDPVSAILDASLDFRILWNQGGDLAQAFRDLTEILTSEEFTSALSAVYDAIDDLGGSDGE